MSKRTWKRGTCEQSVLNAIKTHDGLMGKEIAAVVGISYQSVNEALKRLSEKKQVYICGWKDTDAYHTVAQWAYGDMPDVPKPSPYRVRDYKAESLRKVACAANDDDEKFERQLAIEIARKVRAALSQPIFRHPQDIAFFGPARRAA